MSFALTELIDLNVLRELAESLWRSSGLPTKIIDPQGRILAASGNQDLCILFHRRHPVTLRRCIRSDTEIDELLHAGNEEGPPLETRCRNGLNHIGLPIVAAGRHLATLFLSQFLYDPPDEEVFRRRASAFGLDEEKYLAALRRVPILDRDRVKEVVAFYRILVRLLTEMITREQDLLNRERFEALIAGISTRFVEEGSAGFDRAVEAALAAMMAFAGADRSYLFLLSEDRTRMSNTHEVCTAGISCEKERLQDLPVAEFPWIMGRLLAREVVLIPRVAELPPEAAKEKRHFLAQEIRSLLSVPVISGGAVAGFAGFDAVRAEKVWDERDVVLLGTFGEILGSALERRQAAETLEYRARLEHLIATLSTRMVNLEAEEVDAAIEAALKELGEFAEVDRCYLFQFSADGLRLSNTHEWGAAGVPLFKKELQDIPIAMLPWFVDKIRRREVVYIPEVADLGPEARLEKVEFEREGIRSLLCVPLLVEERLLGFIGLDAVRRRKKWLPEAMLLLRIVGECFANALERRRRDRALRESRQKLEGALREAEEGRERIAAILGSVKTGLVGVDGAARIMLVNGEAEEILGIAEDFARGELISDLPIETALKKQIAAVLAGETPAEILAWEISARQGGVARTRTIQARTDPILSAAGRCKGAITLLRDISVEREVDRVKSEFISTAAHELRTPLSTVLGYAELLLDQATSGDFAPGQQREFLEEIVRKAEALAGIVNDLLDLSRIESGQIVRLERGPARLEGILAEVVEDFRRRHSGHRFETDFPALLPETSLDSAKIRQVLENLLGNAVKFSPPGTRIRVEAMLSGERIEVGVEDEGIGMQPEVLARIFDKFYREDASNTAKAGLGLGLTIARNIIEAHGGAIEVESVPGRRTRVTFSLPLAP